MKRNFTVIVALLAWLGVSAQAQNERPPKERRAGQARQDRPGKDRRQPKALPTAARQLEDLSIILGQPTDRSMTVSLLSAEPREGYIEYGLKEGEYTARTATAELPAGTPVDVRIDGLDRDKRYFYRLQHRKIGPSTPPGAFTAASAHSFHTQRAPGSAFTFEIQGDSHPERPQQFDPRLYAQTLLAAAADRPDFYMTIGDDFSVDTLRTVNAETVGDVYLNQRMLLGLVAHSAPLLLVNGNHEQAALCNLDGTAGNVAVWAQTSRNRLFPQPGPDGFYSGDGKPVEHIGLLRDYHAWTWGDALFVVIDPYWHSKQPVDNVFGERDKGKRDLWGVTLGDQQYQWLKTTLESSKARYKFVFAHHVLGTGRGGIEQAGLFEWGGKNKKGVDEFARQRPGWAMPIHQLMAANGVTIFFQGHDHVFVRQQLDGVVYQTLPEPADPFYALYNKDAYRSGDILPNSGRVRVTVAPEKVRVEYVRSRLPKDANAQQPDGEVAFAYEIPASKPAAATAAAKAKDDSAPKGVVALGAQVTELAKGFQFTEGPARDKQGNVYFSDVHASRTYKWSPDGKVSLFRENTGSANGQAFDKDGNLLACEGANGRVVAVDAKGSVTVVADKYDGKRFNQPNDLWIDPNGGVYFTDPLYSRGERPQGGEHVYYVTADRKKVIRVIDDMVRPNGLVGTPDGRTLYVADHGASKTYRYTVKADGTLGDKTLFASKGSDGMKLDRSGNLYITTDAVEVYSPAGRQIARIAVPQEPTNLCFAGSGGTMLFITARTAIYAVEVGVAGAGTASQTPRGPQGSFLTDVPAHGLDIILGRPSASSVTLSVLCYDDARAYVAFGPAKDDLAARTEAMDFEKGKLREIVLAKLKPDTQYYYQLRDAADKPLPGGQSAGAFHTQRAAGSAFVFTVQADSHLDENASPDLYRRTLANALADSPDFHVDLGDTFMVDKHPGRDSAATQYLAQRYYLGLIGRAAPIFLVLGNHDGEEGKLLKGGADSLAVWSNTMRKRYFPNPVPDGFYSGNAAPDRLAGPLQDYYAWQWGDAMFVVLDPYWHTPGRGGDDLWRPTLGLRQYNWLKTTLEQSKAGFKFVFIHQLVGGAGQQGRGGVEAAPFGEWGGRNADGSDGFKEHRPGWDMPIHELLVRNHVSAVFHGHDHLFARQDLDGIVYQEVPQPGCPGNGMPPRQAGEYGYKSGTILGSSGHLRVTVSPSKAAVEYVRAWQPTDENGKRQNGQIGYAYEIPSAGNREMPPR
jgi:sugar lactone lactonase YvrE/phosphodiesterase/alkaline phosphatase D-like protein